MGSRSCSVVISRNSLGLFSWEPQLLAAGYEGGIRRECLDLDMIVATMLGFQGEKVSSV